MRFKQLEIFVQVVRLKSFTKAAEAIYLSQPTVSAHVDALEEELGVKLLIRSTKEVYPSAAGKLLYKYALDLLDLRDQAISEIKSGSTQVKGLLEVAASTVPSLYLLPQVMSRMLERYPGLSFSVKQFDSVEVVQQIADMESEIGVTGASFDRPGIIFEPVALDRMVIITPNTEAFARLNGVITPRELMSCRFITREQGSGTRKESELFLRKIGLEPSNLRTSVMLESTESVIQGVKNGLGVSIVSRYACADCLAAGGILAFDFPGNGLDRLFYAVYRKNRPLSPAAKALIATLKEVFPIPVARNEEDK